MSVNHKIVRKLKKVDLENVLDVPHKGQTIPAKVVDVYDGDTCKIVFMHGGKIPMKISIRIMGIDTPEIRGKDPLEKQAAIKVRDQVRKWIDGKIVQVKFLKWDKFGGRIDGEVYFGDLKSVGDELISMGYAKAYKGKKKKKWTQEELEGIMGRERNELDELE